MRQTGGKKSTGQGEVYLDSGGEMQAFQGGGGGGHWLERPVQENTAEEKLCRRITVCT